MRMARKQKGFSSPLLILAIAAVAAVIAVTFFQVYDKEDDVNTSNQLTASAEYNPQINPADFSSNITNPYFSLPTGQKLTYEAKTDEGIEKVVVEISGETKVIAGVTTLVYLDTVTVDGQTVEVTRDYLAQHKNGDVWYFGEDVDNYENGKLVDHAGSFIHGTDGAKAGIWIKADNKAGDSYRQEYYKGEAEDMRDVVAVNQTVKTSKETYTGCVKFYDWTPLDKQSKEHKYHCPGIAAMVLSEHLVKAEKAELVSSVEP